jgi:L-fuculose-phosphate aldolase
MKNKKDLIARFRALGAAALNYDIEDSHSGNIAQRWTDENGTEWLVITSTGSQKGALGDTDIVFVGLKGTNAGHYKASSETDIHHDITALPGFSASMHAHTKYATIETFDDAAKPNKPSAMVPIDPLGWYYLKGAVPVNYYKVPCGSPEMVRLIPKDLERFSATMVQGHGTFARGDTPNHAFYTLCVVNNSAQVLYHARHIGVDVKALQAAIQANPAAHFAYPPEPYSLEHEGRCDVADEPSTVREFITAGYRIFESRISPFHTGSMSLRGVRTMIYTPQASMPKDLPGPILEMPLEIAADDSPEVRIHKEIYARTPIQTVMHTYIPEAEAASHWRYPGESTETDRVIPIDGEGGFLYLVIPVVGPKVETPELIEKLHQYKTVIVRGGGVWAVGEQSISEVLHHPSSVRDICIYRFGAIERGLDITKMEPAKARHW